MSCASAATTAPSPTFRSFFTNAVGGGPISTGTFGAPFGSGSATATQGLPFTELAARVVEDATVELVVESVLSLLPEFANGPISAATMANTSPAAPPVTIQR